MVGLNCNEVVILFTSPCPFEDWRQYDPDYKPCSAGINLIASLGTTQVKGKYFTPTGRFVPPRVYDVLDVTPPQALSNAHFADYDGPLPSMLEYRNGSGDLGDCQHLDSGWWFGERPGQDGEKNTEKQEEKQILPNGAGGLKDAIQQGGEAKRDINTTGNECGDQLSSMEDDDGQQGFSTCGTTSLVVIITDQHVICCNSGDSRAVLASEGVSRPLSKDHKPDSPSERARYPGYGQWRGG